MTKKHTPTKIVTTRKPQSAAENPDPSSQDPSQHNPELDDPEDDDPEEESPEQQAKNMTKPEDQQRAEAGEEGEEGDGEAEGAEEYEEGTRQTDEAQTKKTAGKQVVKVAPKGKTALQAAQEESGEADDAEQARKEARGERRDDGRKESGMDIHLVGANSYTMLGSPSFKAGEKYHVSTQKWQELQQLRTEDGSKPMFAPWGEKFRPRAAIAMSEERTGKITIHHSDPYAGQMKGLPASLKRWGAREGNDPDDKLVPGQTATESTAEDLEHPSDKSDLNNPAIEETTLRRTGKITTHHRAQQDPPDRPSREDRERQEAQAAELGQSRPSRDEVERTRISQQRAYENSSRSRTPATQEIDEVTAQDNHPDFTPPRRSEPQPRRADDGEDDRTDGGESVEV